MGFAAAPAQAATRSIIIGDSVALGNFSATSSGVALGTRSWFTHFLLQSQGHATFLWNAARRGTTSTEWLTWYQSEVIDRHPDLVIIQAPTTDSNRGIPLAQTEENIRSMVDQALQAGATVAIGNVLPRPTGHSAIAALNSWLSSYSASTGVPLIDSYDQVVDPSTGNLLPQYDSGDGIHPNADGAAVLGANAAATLAPVLDPDPTYLTPALPDASSLVADGLFTLDRNGDGRPDGWALPSVVDTQYSLATDPSSAGNLLVVTRDGPSGDPQVGVDQMIPSTKWQPGETLALAARINISGTLLKVTFRLLSQTPSGSVQAAAVGPGGGTVSPTGTAYITEVLPAGTTRVDVQLLVSGGVGSVKLGQVTLTVSSRPVAKPPRRPRIGPLRRSHIPLLPGA
jgi:acyl-CoA thioesterase-1